MISPSNSFDLSEQILVSLRQITRAIDLYSKQLFRQVGLTTPQLLVLKAIHSRHTPTVGAISASVSLSQATVTPIVDRLVKAGYVERRKDDIDKRKVILSVSERGLRAIEQSPSLLQEKFTTELEQLAPWEQTLLLSSLQRVASMMNVEHLTTAPVLTSADIAKSR